MIDKKAFVGSVAINLFFLGLCLFFGNLRFGAIDDYFMSGILSGIYGEGNNVHLTFVNALYGYCLLPFYSLFPKINWYYIGEMASVFISLSVAGYIIIRKIGDRWGIVFASMLTALCASDFYLVLQFTQCASILSASGMLAFIYGLGRMVDFPQNKKCGILTIAVGIGLLLWGSWMRWPAFLMGLPFFAGALLLLVKKFWQIKWHVFAALIVLFSIVFACYEFNRSLYQGPGYKEYMEFQGPRALLGDGQNYNQQAVYEELDELGYSGKDFAMFTEWTFYDNEVFAPDSVRVITDLIKRHYYTTNVLAVPSMILNALEKSARRPAFMLWLAFCASLFFFRSSKNIWPWVSLLLIGFMMAYLLNLQRLVYRVELGLWLYSAMMAVPFFEKKYRLPKIFFVIIIALIAISNLVSYATTGTQVRSPNGGNLIIQQEDEKDSADFQGFFDYVNMSGDSMAFFMSMNSYERITFHRLPPYLAESPGSWKKMYCFGFWTPYFPDVETAFHKRGVVNPIKDVVKDNVLVVDEPSLADFLERHYYSKVRVDTVRNFNGIVIYKYSVVKDSVSEVSP